MTVSHVRQWEEAKQKREEQFNSKSAKKRAKRQKLKRKKLGLSKPSCLVVPYRADSKGIILESTPADEGPPAKKLKTESSSVEQVASEPLEDSGYQQEEVVEPVEQATPIVKEKVLPEIKIVEKGI